MSNQDLIILLIFVFSYMVSTFVLIFSEDIINWYIFKQKNIKKEVKTMKYWKKKIKKEFNVDIKKIKLKNEYGIFNIYIAYKPVDEKSIDVIVKIFNDPREIWKNLKQEELQDEILELFPKQQKKESDVWVEHTLKDFKKDRCNNE